MTDKLAQIQACAEDAEGGRWCTVETADVLALCPQPEFSKKRTWNGRGSIKLGTGVRICVWKRTGIPFPPSRVMWAWEPLIVRTPHWRQRNAHDFVEDVLYATQPRGFLGNQITGQKPLAFCHWMFNLLGLGPNDELDDLFPGSGAVGRAWESWRNQGNLLAAEALEHVEMTA